MQRDPKLLHQARRLRQNATPAEQQLWRALRDAQRGVRFSRQITIGPYIVDCVARRARLVIELDGDTHATQVAYDAARTSHLERQGYRVLRFTNADVMTNLAGVLDVITTSLAPGDAPRPSPPPGGGRESVAVPSPGGGLSGGRSLTQRRCPKETS